MNIFDKITRNLPKSFKEDEVRAKILAVAEPELYSFMSSEQKEKLKLVHNVRGDGNLATGKKQEIKSIYAHEARKVFEIVNEISPSMCLAKWYNVSIHIPTGKTHSCYHPPAHHIPLEEIKADPSAIHNTKHKKEQRLKMLKGERPEECNFCWDIEDSGEQLSDRAYRSKDVYRPGMLEDLAANLHTGNVTPRYVEVNFNQACNFKCAYCSPHLSTEWMKEAEKHGPYVLADKRTHNDVRWMKEHAMPDNSPDNPYLTAFWEWFPTVYPGLQTFRMTGGEPLMDKNTFKVFDYVSEHPKGDELHLSITSNCCPPKGQWKKFIKALTTLEKREAIDHFMLYCSLDSWGKQAEYIRNGLDFDVMYKNIREYLKKGSKHSLTFIVTFNALSIPGWLEYVKNILKLRQEFNTTRQLVWFDVPMLMDPDWLSLKILPTGDLQALRDSIEFMEANIETKANPFKGFKDYEVDKVRRLLDWASNPYTPEEALLARANFHAFYTEHDKRRGTNFAETFPELRELIQLSDRASKIYRLK